VVAAGCGEWQVKSNPADDAGVNDGGTGGVSPGDDYPTGFKVVGNRIEDSEGNRIVLRGVNRSGTEYKCVENKGIFDGSFDEESVRAMTTWGINAVRIPLNESCWLAINGVAEDYSGPDYKAAILDYVALLHRYAIVPILDLHWAAPGDELAANVPDRGYLRPLPNIDHSIDFWRDVAATFRNDEGVVLEPYNEPFPDGNGDGDAAWQCWRDGCEAESPTGATYAAAGMQVLVDAIRDAGARHLILLGGVQYSNDLSQWLAYKPNDRLDNLAAAWHVYNFNECSYSGCWTSEAGAVAVEFPIVATEIGQSDCLGESFLSPLMSFLDQQGSGYLAWSWNVLAEGCVPRPPRGGEGNPWALITSYDSPQPKSAYAAVFRKHMLGVTP
jgi:hypothetical protein